MEPCMVLEVKNNAIRLKKKTCTSTWGTTGLSPRDVPRVGMTNHHQILASYLILAQNSAQQINIS